MDAVINVVNRAWLEKIHAELFKMANSYVGDEYGIVACRMHLICNHIFEMQKQLVKLFEGAPVEDRYGREPDKVKSLAQYLSEYLEQETDPRDNHADFPGWRELLEQALDAYESTEQVKIKIERI